MTMPTGNLAFEITSERRGDALRAAGRAVPA